MLEVFRFLDKTVGTGICLVLASLEGIKRLFTKTPLFDPKLVKSILVIKTVALGDLTLILPTLRAVKETYPSVKLCLLTTPRVKEVVSGFPYLDEIIYFKPPNLGSLCKTFLKLRKKKFSLVIDAEHYYRFTTILAYLLGAPWRVGFILPGQGRKGLFNLPVSYPLERHEVESFLSLAKAIGAKVSQVKLVPLVISSSDEEFIKKFLKENGVDKDDFIVVIHPATSLRAKARRWLPERWAELADKLISQFKAKIIFSGARSDGELVKKIVNQMKFEPILAVGQTTLKQFAALTKKANLFIGVDTGPLHVAAAMGTKVIGLFGPNTPLKWGPYGKKNIAIYHPLPCSPCTKQYLGIVSSCEKDDCMRAITVEEVMDAVKKIIKKR